MVGATGGFVQSADVLKACFDVAFPAAAVAVGGEAEAAFVVGGGAAPGLAPLGLRGGGEGGVGGDRVVWTRLRAIVSIKLW